jgi:hypothetical protein
MDSRRAPDPAASPRRGYGTLQDMARPLIAIALLLSLSIGLFALQRGRGGGGGFGRAQLSFDEGSNVPSEFYFSRLRYNSGYAGGGSFGFGRGGGTWSQDFPRADNDCLIVLRRLTRINATAGLNVVDIDSDAMFNYPWVYAVDVSTWSFTDDEAKRLRDYLLKGGFLMVDHFHGPAEWSRFMAGMSEVLPGYTVEDLPDSDEIYHVLYNIDEKFQIPGEQYVGTGRTYECRSDGCATVPIWRAIRDEHGRIIVAICANMHLGDAWEHANEPYYPEKFSGLAFRIVFNYITYSMTH